MKNIYPIVIVPASIIIPIAVALTEYTQLKKQSKILLFYLVVSGCINLAAVILASKGIHNLHLLHFYTIVEFAVLSLFFKQILTGKFISGFINCLIFVFTALCIINFSFLQSINKFNTYTRPIEAILLIGYCLVYFERESRIIQSLSWVKNAVNWMVTGILLYFSGALFLFAFSNVVSIKVSPDIKIQLWNVHATLVLIMYVLFAIGFRKCKS